MIELVPVVIQGSNKPCFRIGAGTGDKLFCDSGCGQVLIENYFKENFIGIVLRCFQCGTITKTPGLEAGEVLANRIVNFGNDGQFLLMSTVDVPACVSLTCDNEIRRELEFSAPRSGGSTLDLSEQGLNELIANYEILSEGKFELQIRIVRRLGIRSAKEFPFAWAIDHLKQCIQKQTIDIKDHQTVTAIVWVMTFKNILLIWGHNPRFTKIGRDLAKPNSFLHTAAQLIVAAYLFNNNNRVGLSLEYEPARPNPDLYIRFGNGQKFFLEVKAPKALQWDKDIIVCSEGINAAVKKSIKGSFRQIGWNSRGVLVISSSLISPGIGTLLEKSIQNTLKSKGRDHKYLAAGVGVSPQFSALWNGKNLQSSLHFQFSVTKNIFYDGENPIITD